MDLLSHFWPCTFQFIVCLFFVCFYIIKFKIYIFLPLAYLKRQKKKKELLTFLTLFHSMCIISSILVIKHKFTNIHHMNTKSAEIIKRERHKDQGRSNTPSGTTLTIWYCVLIMNIPIKVINIWPVITVTCGGPVAVARFAQFVIQPRLHLSRHYQYSIGLV